MAVTLVTGAAGFIGSHLCEYLLEKGHKVIGVDNFLTGSPENLEQLFGNPSFQFYDYDITHYFHVPGNLDYILHFASPASPKDYLQLPIETMKAGSLGTLHVLGLARSKGAKVVLASTSEVYGDPLVHPQSEEYYGNVNPIGIRGVYDEAKRFSEALVMAYHRKYQLSTAIVRIFNTYGPRMRINDGRVIPTFLSQALQNQDITIYGDGSQTRSFCYVSDLVEGIVRLMESDYALPVNLGNPDEISILDFAKELLQVTGSSSKIVYQPLPQDDPKVRRPDISKAKKFLNWEPKVSRREGLERTIPFFRKKLGL